MRRIAASLACAGAMGLGGCGGGGGSAGTPPPVAAPELRIGAAAGDTGRTPSGVVSMRRIELRNAGNASARAVVVSAATDAQAQQLPLSCETAGCTPRSDGGVEIAEIAAGATVTLQQRLRVKPGYRGTIRNDWQASTTGNSLTWRQELTAYAADLSVKVADPVAADGAASRSTYNVTLANLGPDEASDVNWHLLTPPGLTWRIANCTASAGSNCPATLGEVMTLARLPAGGSVQLQVEMEEPGSTSSSRYGLASRADADGDPDTGNNQAANTRATTQHLFMTDLEGRQYRLSIGLTGTLRATAPGVDYRAPVEIDVTGTGLIGDPDSNGPPWNRGLVNFMGRVMVLGLNIDGVRKPHLAPRALVTQLNDLEGASFNVLGSRADANGKPQDAYVGSARFNGGALLLCLPEAPTPFEQCPAARLSRFEAAVVGSEIELVSRDRVMRLRAAPSPDGPVLISSSRNAATGGSEFWLALPSPPRPTLSTFLTSLHETTFESASGQSTAALAGIRHDSSDHPLLDVPSTPMSPSVALLYLQSTGKLGLCGLSAQLSDSAQSGVYQGVLHGDWLPGTFADGQFVKERPCFAGAVHHVQARGLAVLLGARGGDLMGRWMFVSE